MTFVSQVYYFFYTIGSADGPSFVDSIYIFIINIINIFCKSTILVTKYNVSTPKFQATGVRTRHKINGCL